MSQVIIAYDDRVDDYFEFKTGPNNGNTAWANDALSKVFTYSAGFKNLKMMQWRECVARRAKFIYPISFRYYTRHAWQPYHFKEFEDVYDWIPEPVRQACRDGRAILMFDDKVEGFPIIRNSLFTYLEELAKRLKIPETAIAYISSNQLARQKYAEYCRRALKSPTMTIEFVPWMRLLSSIEFSNVAPAPKDENPKVYLCYNRHFNMHRQHFVFDLYLADLLKFGLVSLAADDRAELHNAAGHLTWAMSAQEAESLAKKWPEFQRTLPYIIDTADFKTNHANSIDTSAYAKTWMSVITETWAHADTRFITEKTFKAMCMEHPFILLGNPGSMTSIHEQGFQTFNPLIDESYDRETDLRYRRKLVMSELKRICSLSDSQKRKLFGAVREVTSFNRKEMQRPEKRVAETIERIYEQRFR